MNFTKNIRYIIDNKGKKTHVILPIKVFEMLMEDLQDIKEATKRKKDKKISYKEMKKKLSSSVP